MELFKKPCKEVIAYTDGALDGDGCISINRRANRYSLRICQSEVNRGKEWAEWFQKEWGMGFARHSRGHLGGSVMWNWHVTRLNQAEFILNLLLPYLFIK